MDIEEQQREDSKSAAPFNPIRTVAVVLYVTLALLALAIPSATSSWLKELNSNAARPALIAIARAVEDLSSVTVTEWPFHQARHVFLQISGKKDK